MMAWLIKLKGMNMLTVDKRKRAAMSAIIQASGVSENAVVRVIDALKEVDAVGVVLLLDLGKDEEPVVEDATFEDGAPKDDGLSDIGRDGTS